MTVTKSFSSVSGKDLKLAAELLREGHLVAIPTETVYGLAANGLDENAVLDIFKVKNRPQFDHLILHVASLSQATDLVSHIPPLAEKLAAEFWPGPLTLLLDKTDRVPDLVTSGLPRVALRVPEHPLTLELLQQLDFPLAAPSANPFSYVSPTTAEHVYKQLGQQVSYIIDGGPSRVGIESTIIGFESGKPVVYRLGGLRLEEIEEITGELDIQTHEGQSPVAPGMIKNHYAPHCPLVLGDIADTVDQATADGTLSSLGILSFTKDWSERGAAMALRLSEDGSLDDAAYHIFSALRTLDESGATRIIAEEVPDVELGRAINDRLRRASAARSH
jgi:L-threonylcarbamoyladenylate synthase